MNKNHVKRHHFKRLSPEKEVYEPLTLEEVMKNFSDWCANLKIQLQRFE